MTIRTPDIKTVSVKDLIYIIHPLNSADLSVIPHQFSDGFISKKNGILTLKVEKTCSSSISCSNSECNPGLIIDLHEGDLFFKDIKLAEQKLRFLEISNTIDDGAKKATESLNEIGSIFDKLSESLTGMFKDDKYKELFETIRNYGK